MISIQQRYVNWMRSKIEASPRYSCLLRKLDETPFRYVISRDGNREGDGIDLRYRFGEEAGISQSEIAYYLDVRPCSVLEMMVALSIRTEEQIMSDSNYGDRTGTWFWHMIRNLGLANMTNDRFDSRYVEEVLSRFLNREYDADGSGGLFRIHNRNKNMRDAEIWCQLMWYLNELRD